MLLIVENDLGFARFLLERRARKGFKGLVTRPAAAALSLITRVHADDGHARHLPARHEGWRVLDRLKDDLATRHIPVCVVSTDERASAR